MTCVTAPQYVSLYNFPAGLNWSKVSWELNWRGGWMTLTLSQEQSKSEYCSEHPFLMDVSDGEKSWWKIIGEYYISARVQTTRAPGLPDQRKCPTLFIQKKKKDVQLYQASFVAPLLRQWCPHGWIMWSGVVFLSYSCFRLIKITARQFSCHSFQEKKNVQGGFIQQALFLKSEPKIPSSVSIWTLVKKSMDIYLFQKIELNAPLSINKKKF